MSDFDTPTGHDEIPSDDFDRRARAAGAALRRPAPADGLRHVTRARRQQQVVRGAVGVGAAVAIVGVGALIFRGDGDAAVVVNSPGTTSASSIPSQTVPSTETVPLSEVVTTSDAVEPQATVQAMPDVAVAATDAPDPAPSASNAATSEAPVVIGSSCLVGDWTIANDQLSAYYASVGGATGYADMSVNGTIAVSFTEDAYSYTQNFSTSFSVTRGSNDAVVTTVNGGVVSGTWSAVGNVVSATDETQARTLEVREDGVVVEDSGDLFVGVYQPSPLDDVRFTCDGPTVMLKVGEMGFDGGIDGYRFPVTLTPA